MNPTEGWIHESAGKRPGPFASLARIRRLFTPSSLSFLLLPAVAVSGPLMWLIRSSSISTVELAVCITVSFLIVSALTVILMSQPGAPPNLQTEKVIRARLERRLKDRTAELLDAGRRIDRLRHKLKAQRLNSNRFERMSGIRTLAAGIAHELNNPLLVVIGYSEILHDAATDPDFKKKIGSILKNGIRCAEIVKSLLIFAQKEKLQYNSLDVNQVVDSALELARTDEKYKEITVTKQLDPSLPTTLLDETLMRQVFLNVSLNAFHAMSEHHPNGRFMVSTECVDDHIRVRFTDEGPGIPTVATNKIFDPFFTTKDVGRGAGLGLSVALGIVEQHGGQIYVEKTGPEGTTFAIELPIVSDVTE